MPGMLILARLCLMLGMMAMTAVMTDDASILVPLMMKIKLRISMMKTKMKITMMMVVMAMTDKRRGGPSSLQAYALPVTQLQNVVMAALMVVMMMMITVIAGDADVDEQDHGDDDTTLMMMITVIAGDADVDEQDHGDDDTTLMVMARTMVTTS
ncbi:hypothetical protein AK812_SmicGene22088 [Symbiodinium microadriaticum]|uniref:Secreted protein n=1 Tax=Symbiodinium microadriaticum TaxID=2951 RepID=A0A1Q9DKQ3_SYMMI|nr:hypothetical protein AK812_SmicGene22088 [Symbiodinium microadriaticum]